MALAQQEAAGGGARSGAKQVRAGAQRGAKVNTSVRPFLPQASTLR